MVHGRRYLTTETMTEIEFQWRSGIEGLCGSKPMRKVAERFGVYRCAIRYLVPLGSSAAGTFVLGGEVADPGGECASEASSGLDVTGVPTAT